MYQVDKLGDRDWGRARKKIEHLLDVILHGCGIELSYDVTAGGESGSSVVGVEFQGSDTRLLLARNGELLHALESLAVDVLELSPEEHELISFDAEGFKAARAQRMRRAAEVAVASVRSTERPYSFPPMNSRERRMLHLELASSGLRTASSGEASRRFVVLYPPERTEQQRGNDSRGREKSIRSAFRPR